MTLVHDHDRPRRIGMPEAVLCEGKQDAHLVEVVATLAAAGQPILLTRLPADRAARLDLAAVASDAAHDAGTGNAPLKKRIHLDTDTSCGCTPASFLIMPAHFLLRFLATRRHRCIDTGT